MNDKTALMSIQNNMIIILWTLVLSFFEMVRLIMSLLLYAYKMADKLHVLKQQAKVVCAYD